MNWLKWLFPSRPKIPSRPAPPLPPEGILAAFIEAHNDERGRLALPPLSSEPHLQVAATSKSTEMASMGKMDHSGFPQRIYQAGYPPGGTIGENLAFGYTSPQAAVNAWMDDPPHRANVLNPAFRQLGGAATSDADGRLYYCCDYGG